MGTHIDASVSALLQHSISGTGNFTGVEVGRAYRTLGALGAAVTVKARELGSESNAYHVQFVDPGGVVPTTQARWVDPTHLKVYLRRNAGGLLATADEVAAKINAMPDPRVVAVAAGTDPVVAIADAALAGGLNAAQVGAEYRMTPAANVSGGLFFFGNEDSVDVIQVVGRFPGLGGSVTVKLQVVSLGPGYEPIEAEAFTFFTATVDGTTPDFFCDKRPLMGPRQAVRVVAAAPGVVQVVVRRSERPYLGA